MHQILFIYAIIILSIFSTAATESTSAPASNRTLDCYKYERNFTDVNFINPPAEEKDVTKCDQCFSYICYSKNDEYVLGNGCREDFFQTCNLASLTYNYRTKYINKEKCVPAKNRNATANLCLRDYCNHNNLPSCITLVKKTFPTEPIGPGYTYANVTFTQLTTPAPTTRSIPITQSVDGNHGGSDNDNQNHPGSNASKNSFILLMIFFGIFIFDYFM
uniref:Uncharacterized protein n=1 Tax=Panagrolaimus sp. ES5 TaxID=591445 RepID=A0AC34FZX3_9BILA